MGKVKYYRLDNILKENADYNIIYGERSNGKTFSVLEYGLKDYIDSGYTNQLGIVRRWEEDFKGKNGSQMFEAIVKLGLVSKWTKDYYNSVYYWGQRWYLAKFDEMGKLKYKDDTPFAFGFGITSEEHYKSTSYPNIRTVLFDEFITRSYYLPDEFVKFQNLLSTIIRLRDDIKIFMCGNTINKYCPYFTEMGLTNASKQKQGTIDVYTYGDSGLRVAVEYAEEVGSQKKSNKYFAFDNPKLQMIKTGGWEIDIYPHLPCKYYPTEVRYKFYIIFNGETLQGNVIYSKNNDCPFIFFHRKTTPIKEDDKGLVFQEAIDARRKYRRRITDYYDKIGKKLYGFFARDEVFYQDNEVGEIVRNYLMWCEKSV